MMKKDGEEMRLENIENEEKIVRKEVQWEREDRKEKERECVRMCENMWERGEKERERKK